MDNSLNKNNHCWYITTRNSYQAIIIGDWCKIFGSELEETPRGNRGEPTHYFELLKHPLLSEKLSQMGIQSEQQLKEKLLTDANLNEDEFNKYRTMAMKCRNKFFAHREHNPSIIKVGDIISPDTNIAFNTCKAFYLILLHLIKLLPSEMDINWMCDIHLFSKQPSSTFDKLIEEGKEIFITKNNNSFKISYRRIEDSKIDSKPIESEAICEQLSFLDFNENILPNVSDNIRIYKLVYELVNSYSYPGHTNIYTIDYHEILNEAYLNNFLKKSKEEIPPCI